MQGKGTKKSAVPIATEAQEQAALFSWAARSRVKYPELELLFHIPNEGKRSVITGHALKAQGMRPGVPDICLPVPNVVNTALYIELKRRNGGKVSEAQRSWIEALNRIGARAVVCNGWDEAREEIERYLGWGRRV